MSTVTRLSTCLDVDRGSAKPITKPELIPFKSASPHMHKGEHCRTSPNVIELAFLKGRTQWLEESGIGAWADPDPTISATLAEVNRLYQEWQKHSPGPFYPFSDPLWLQTCTWLREAGLPWHNNNLNLPEEIDPSWPFHFKEFERQAVLSKGSRVSKDQVSGYVCDWAEANQYAIRALQQESRRQKPSQRPLLVGARIEPSILQSAAQLFGLESVQLGHHWCGSTVKLTDVILQQRPIIFAATLTNSQGEMDDFTAIDALSKKLPLLLHVDASRNFDYITTLSEDKRKQLGLPRLMLRYPRLGKKDSDRSITDVIIASTIVAGGMNWVFPPKVTSLKPCMLGTLSKKVEYVRGTDATLAGSRDALGPLLVALQEVRLGVSGMQAVYARCSHNRDNLWGMLVNCGMKCERPHASLDLIVSPEKEIPGVFWRKWGWICRDNGSFLLTLQPSVSTSDIEGILSAVRSSKSARIHSMQHMSPRSGEYPLRADIADQLAQKVAGWRGAARRSGGYPLSHALYSALGPVIAHFLPLSIPYEWTEQQSLRILQDRKLSFGIAEAELESFSATFTTGSTMGNRVGLHMALANHPNAFVYFSSASHYSIKKSVTDHDGLAGRWHPLQKSRFTEIPADELGRIDIDLLVKQAMADRKWAVTYGEPYRIILLANLGTTFVGGSDDIVSIRRALHREAIDTSYIHVDGALDFGFSSCYVRLGEPSLLTRANVPVVQGVTMSHHKVWGIMVSGEVICYNPKQLPLATVSSSVEPRIVFETWLAQKFYTPTELKRVHAYCLSNADFLRRRLREIGVAIRYNDGSLTTVLERVPPWMVEEFHLAPEGEWVHYITMPHISVKAIEHFVETIAAFNDCYSVFLEALQPDMSAALGLSVKLQRIRCCESVLYPKIIDFLESNADAGAYGQVFEMKFASSALSFCAIGACGRPVAVALVNSSARRTIELDRICTVSAVASDLERLEKMTRMGLRNLEQMAGLHQSANSAPSRMDTARVSE
ncbi:MAG: hypothetical protein LQ352_004273 [Teloschistes flavicans]|nr:MAG: hypothetical protein LQ352_004273 [Teloschistes flavicans]